MRLKISKMQVAETEPEEETNQISGLKFVNQLIGSVEKLLLIKEEN